MNKQESDILNALLLEPFINQRILAEISGHSLGVVNRSIKELMKQGYLDEDVRLTDKARHEFNTKAPQKAIILAAGFGMRMVPINLESPKALLEVNGERLIDRQIKQLHEVGIKDIYIVVGFMKEQFEYLIDEYGVQLIVNQEYATKNNYYSMVTALKGMEVANTYIVPCDIWCDRKPFHSHELYSWYMVSDLVDEESDVRVNRKMELVRIKNSAGNAMIGIAYLLKEDMEKLKEQLDEIKDDGSFWEEALYIKDRMFVAAHVVHASEVVEINTYEQLRELDSDSQQLKSDVIKIIAEQLHTTPDSITDISVLKKGMTNRSFLFSCEGKKYIMRIPGEGTDLLINRREEAAVYQAIAGEWLCDDPVYINPENGYKITAFLDNVRVCDPLDVKDLRKCIGLLKQFHDLKLKVDHEFDIFGQIDFYESLWNGKPSMYKDYRKTKENVRSLIPFIEANIKEKILTHIDANQDNFLFYEQDEITKLQLTDWEYAGMQDPDVDIAMFAIYAFYNKRQTDRLISIYFDGECETAIRAKIYAYMAACGLLWSNWCEYKSTLGVEFGEYCLRQYRYAKEYYRYALEEIKKIGGMADE
ncbi:NTP transferase domain-containing protein [Trichococcus ilyis]|nr:NTP transferase domain-containing protein [Trichococcus ilyis]